jgi:hypothetical protein
MTITAPARMPAAVLIQENRRKDIMSREIPFSALLEVLEYLHKEELRHYIECRLDGDAEDHIYLHVLELLRWLEQSAASGSHISISDFAGACLAEYEIELDNKVEPAA